MEFVSVEVKEGWEAGKEFGRSPWLPGDLSTINLKVRFGPNNALLVPFFGGTGAVEYVRQYAVTGARSSAGGETSKGQYHFIGGTQGSSLILICADLSVGVISHLATKLPVFVARQNKDIGAVAGFAGKRFKASTLILISDYKYQNNLEFVRTLHDWPTVWLKPRDKNDQVQSVIDLVSAFDFAPIVQAVQAGLLAQARRFAKSTLRAPHEQVALFAPLSLLNLAVLDRDDSATYLSLQPLFKGAVVRIKEAIRRTPWVEVNVKGLGVGEDGRLGVEINGDLHDKTMAVQHALEALPVGKGLFIFGNHLAIINQTETGTGTEMLTVQTLNTYLYQQFRFFGRNVYGELKNVELPRTVTENFLSLGQWSLPRVKQILHHPTFGKEWRLLGKGGYHPDEEIFMDLRGLELLDVPEVPSGSDLAEAKENLEDIFIDFHFSDEASRTNTIALIITLLIRNRIVGNCPIFGVGALCNGSGKGLLVDLCTLVALGLQLPSTTWEDSETATKRLITTKVLSNPEAIKIDNIAKKVDSPSLASILTTDVWEDRLVLGASTICIPVQVIWILTGNKLALSGEIARRTIRININPDADELYLRSNFRHADVEKYVLDNRPKLLRSVLVIIQYWIDQGKPESDLTLGSFDRWAKIVGGILEAAGYQEFMGNVGQSYGGQQDLDRLWQDFFLKWQETYGENPVKASALVELLQEMGIAEVLLGKGNAASLTKRLGRRLESWISKMVGQYRLVNGEYDRKNKVKTYRLVLSVVKGKKP